jgi:hypothetical protein
VVIKQATITAPKPPRAIDPVTPVPAATIKAAPAQTRYAKALQVNKKGSKEPFFMMRDLLSWASQVVCQAKLRGQIVIVLLSLPCQISLVC